MKKTETVEKTVKKTQTVKKAEVIEEIEVIEKPNTSSKGTGLFKIAMFILLGILVFTWLFSASYFNEGKIAELGMQNIGFFDYFQLLFGSFEFSYFIQILILLVSIGALYGVLGKTGKYRAWIERISANLVGREAIFLVVAAFFITLITSTFDFGFASFIFIPFIISVILAIGYDKITACLATFGAMLVGVIGNTLGYNIAGVISGLLDITIKQGLVYKTALLVLSFSALLVFLCLAKANRTVKNEEDDMFVGEKNSNKYGISPIIIVFNILFVLLILGCTNWESTFGITFFTKINSVITEFTVKLPYLHITTAGVETGVTEVAIFGKLLGTVSAFGTWYYAEMAVMCLLASLLLGMFYRIKLSDRLAYMAEGAKKMIKPAMLVMIIYCIIYFAGNTMIFPTIAELILGISSKFNVVLSSIVVALGSALHVDMLYVSNYIVPQLAAQDVGSTTVALLTQGIYGVTMFVAPTSALLALGLSYLNISYKEWIKRTWKFTLILLAFVLIITILTMVL